jgi:hypothetical protein
MLVGRMYDLNLGCELDLQIDTTVLTYFADWWGLLLGFENVFYLNVI